MTALNSKKAENLSNIVNIVGGGLAGCEAAWQIAQLGIKVNIYELRNKDQLSEAHQTDILAELVCSNSFRNDDIKSAIGLLHQEMRLLNSLIIKAADDNKVPAGSALAVDRNNFANQIQKLLESHPLINIIRQEIPELPIDDANNHWIIATGPLTSNSLSKSISKNTTENQLAFFDAIAPIIYKDSIDFSKAWFQSRYDKKGPGGDGKDYINCPLSKDQYHKFIEDIINSEKTNFKEWEKNTPYFEGCLPIEIMASRGVETLRFGPLKPVGLTSPHQNEKPYAVVQLRQDNKIGTLYNIVGFQTKMKYGEQSRILRNIPGLEKAEFARFGGIHRNSFINSPKLLDQNLRLKKHPHIRFAGQVSGVEGYVESASMGLLSGIFTAAEIKKENTTPPPKTTAIGSLLNYITNDHLSHEAENNFQPMNVNFGLFPELETKTPKKSRKEAYSNRALQDIKDWIKSE